MSEARNPYLAEKLNGFGHGSRAGREAVAAQYLKYFVDTGISRFDRGFEKSFDRDFEKGFAQDFGKAMFGTSENPENGF